jgi:hypothetical protein
MDWSLSKLIRIEAGNVSVSTNDVKALLSYYDLRDPEEVGQLVDLARASRRRTWWSSYRDKVPAAYFAYIGLETEAVAMSIFRPMGLPGLLQTEAYARAFTRAAAPIELAPAQVDERVELRMRRQREVLDRPHPPRLDVVLDEANLYRRIGGPAVLRDQLRHLMQLGQRDAITIQILPFTAEEYAAYGQFIILEFAGEDSDVVYLEGADSQQVIDQATLVAPYRSMFARLRDISLSPTDSLVLIDKRAQELGSAG